MEWKNLIGIPGRVESAPVLKYRAYGVEAKMYSIKSKGSLLPYSHPFVSLRKRVDFGYRNSVFKNR
jgi:UDP-N-acetylenolpyruvoylglucosamine reductase